MSGFEERFEKAIERLTERHQRLTERHEALTQSIELLTIDIREMQPAVKALLESGTKLNGVILSHKEAIGRLIDSDAHHETMLKALSTVTSVTRKR